MLNFFSSTESEKLLRLDAKVSFALFGGFSKQFHTAPPPLIQFSAQNLLKLPFLGHNPIKLADPDIRVE
jgi:hypothetical protein